MSHQDRREPLPDDYQFPTHSVECDCPSCRSRIAPEFISHPSFTVLTPQWVIDDYRRREQLRVGSPVILEPDENNLWGV